MNINELDSLTQDQLRRRMRELGLDAAPVRRDGQAAPARKKGRIDGIYRSKLERDFAAHLEHWRAMGLVGSWWYERLTLKLADDVRLTPDFVVDKSVFGVSPLRTTVYEVKGPYIRDDARIKLRVAAEQFTWLRWVLVQREQGRWVYTELGAGK